MTTEKTRFTNRELSWVDFNYRVLEEAEDFNNPLFERLKFLAITSSNLDEFYMVRVAGLKQQIDVGVTTTDFTKRTPKEQLKDVSIKAHDFVKAQYKCYYKLVDELKEKGIEIVRPNSLTKIQTQQIDKYYKEIVQPVLTPLAIDASRPFPHLAGKTVNMAISIIENSSNKLVHAIIQIPSILPRFLKLEKNKYILLEDIVLLHAASMFNGYTIKGIALFRLTRNGDLSIDEDAQDLLAEIEKSLQNRRHGAPVRLEIMENFADDELENELCDFLIEHLGVRKRDIFYVNGPLNLTFLFGFSSIKGFEYLKFPNQPPQEALQIPLDENIFDVIRERDILLHHPYESFDTVVNLVVQAAKDEKVLAIKQTLYRVSGNSPIVDALMRAAQAGKQVTVLVELKARFDEENNIAWAKRLEQAGCHVIYGLLGLKVHCKALLIVRREEDGIRRYIHLGTGNYNDSTAKLYTDMGIITANPAITSDLSSLFNVLTGYSMPPQYKKLHVAPTGLRKFFIDKINIEIENSKRGLPSGITAKVNSLIDEGIINKLYEASKAGVQIKLIIRGINGLCSGVKGLSENIQVTSIVGRYLEHHRIYSFVSGGDVQVYLSSADWMPRNLDRRIETLFPVEQEDNKQRVLDSLNLMLSDNVKARIQMSDGSYKHVENDNPKVNSQEQFYKQIKNTHKKDLSAPDILFKPKKRM